MLRSPTFHRRNLNTKMDNKIEINPNTNNKFRNLSVQWLVIVLNNYSIQFIFGLVFILNWRHTETPGLLDIVGLHCEKGPCEKFCFLKSEQDSKNLYWFRIYIIYSILHFSWRLTQTFATGLNMNRATTAFAYLEHADFLRKNSLFCQGYIFNS